MTREHEEAMGALRRAEEQKAESRLRAAERDFKQKLAEVVWAGECEGRREGGGGGGGGGELTEEERGTRVKGQSARG